MTSMACSMFSAFTATLCGLACLSRTSCSIGDLMVVGAAIFGQAAVSYLCGVFASTPSPRDDVHY